MGDSCENFKTNHRILEKFLCSLNFMYVKGTVFFYFREKVHGSFIHSNSKSLFFFFSKNPEKKKYSPFFLFLAVFFFLPKKKFTCHSFNRFWGCFFFPSPEKKTAFSFVQSIFSKSVYKMNFFREKKIRYLWLYSTLFQIFIHCKNHRN